MNTLTLAVAGGRKTQGIADACSDAENGRRILVVSYTTANQAELKARLGKRAPLAAEVTVKGWFSFLLSDWIRPYLPRSFPGRRLRGLNFDGNPGRYATGEGRFLDGESRAYRLHLANLAWMTNRCSDGASLDRLSRIYDEIFVDEVQDLNGYDLEILAELMCSDLTLRMVGDVRQAILQTNVQEPKNAKYKGIQIKTWFEAQRDAGRLNIEHSSTTWRSNQAISSFADSIFDDSWGFEPTTSTNGENTGHDGLFVVHPEHVPTYMERYQPLCLRHSTASAKALALPFTTFGLSKGTSADRVLIAPTAGIVDFLRTGKRLGDGPACSLYVAVTRARASVAFVSDLGAQLGLLVWTP